MRKRKRANWALRLCLAGILAFFVVHVLVLPLIGFALEQAPTSTYERNLQVNQFLGELLKNATEFVVGFWFLFLGTAIGSFLNVVVYRMPIGKSIAAQGSYCPHCRVSIRSYDNIPVLGWIKLRGRCRACRLPIASRYPIVEAFVGLLFLILYLVEVASGGVNLPGVRNEAGYGISSIVLDTRYDVLAIFVFHAVLVSTLVSASLIRYDRNRFPLRLALFGVISAAVMSIGWPELWGKVLRSRVTTENPIESLYPVDAFVFETFDMFQRLSVQSAVTCVCGMLVGSGVGWFVGSVLGAVGSRDPGQQLARRSLCLGFALVGSFLGWQSVLSVLALMVILGAFVGSAGAPFGGTRRVPMLAWASLAAFVHVLLWRELASLTFWPGASDDWRWLIGQLAALTFAVAGFGALHAVLCRAEPTRLDA